MSLQALMRAAALALGLSAGGAQAGALAVSPLMLEMSAQQATRSLEVSNPSDQPMNVQLRLFAWRGGGTEELYAPSQDVAFSPPMFQLAPGGRQVVRFAMRVKPEREMAYRLFVDQIEARPVAGGLSMPVRMALPLFLTPSGSTATKVAWRVETDAGGPLLVARNSGGRRLRVTNLELVGPAGAETVASGLAGYVLAGQERAWRLKRRVDPARMTVRAVTDQGALQTGLAQD